MLPHQPTHFKFNRSLCRDFNAFKSFWVLCNSCGSCSGLKDTKISELQTIILTQLICYLIKKCLNYTFDQNSFCLCSFCNPVDKFFLCNCRHRPPLSGKSD